MATTVGKARSPSSCQEVRVFSGAIEGVFRDLKKAGVQRVVTIPLCGADGELMEQAILRLVGGLPRMQGERTLQAINELITTSVPPITLSTNLVREAENVAAARTLVLKNADWLTAAQVSALAGFSARSPSAQPNK